MTRAATARVGLYFGLLQFVFALSWVMRVSPHYRSSVRDEVRERETHG